MNLDRAFRAAIAAFAQNFVGRHLVEEGIGCEVTAAAPRVARVLGSPYPLARRFAAQALTALLREPCTIDVDASREDIQKALAACGLDVAELPAASAPRGHPAESGDED